MMKVKQKVSGCFRTTEGAKGILSNGRDYAFHGSERMTSQFWKHCRLAFQGSPYLPAFHLSPCSVMA